MMPITKRGRRRFAADVALAQRGERLPLIVATAWTSNGPGSPWWRRHVDGPSDRIQARQRAAEREQRAANPNTPVAQRILDLPYTPDAYQIVDDVLWAARLEGWQPPGRPAQGSIVAEQLADAVRELEFYLRVQPDDRLAYAALNLALLARHDGVAVVETLGLLEALHVPHGRRATTGETP